MDNDNNKIFKPIKSAGVLRRERIEIFTLLLVIIQSCGIRFIPGQGSLLIALVLFLSRDGFKALSKKDFGNLFIIFIFLFINNIFGPNFSISKFIFQYGLVLESYVFLLYYKKKGFDVLLDRFYRALHFIFLHALIGFALYILLRPLYMATTAFGYPYRTFAFLFYIANPDGAIRNTGLLWEPGLLQMMLNIYLFYSIKRNAPIWVLVLITLTIFSTLSTVGFVILGFNYIYFILHNFKKRTSLIIRLIILTFLLSGSLIFIKDNIEDKISGSNTSGLVRYRDYLIGMSLIADRPLLGHGLFETKYLTTLPYVSIIESNVFTTEYLADVDELSGGFTNGLLGIFCWFGVPAGLLLNILFYRNRFSMSSGYPQLVFYLIITLTTISEPITNTAFFLLFPFSFLVFSKRKSV
ncbi:O-antigen ligase family protein [Pedobacter sp. AW31-3R]|uniref:O-antigen ligase family protein n=1 Tax=Pedobacter sp. AW31-3R TaxID=3445781 RepID=UPI003F9F03B9